MSLETGRMVTRGVVTKQPLTPQVIEAVHQLAKKDKMPEGLKITTKAGVILYDSALTAGVDYNQNETNYIETNNYYDALQDEEDDESYSDDDEEDVDLDEGYDEVDPNEIADILSDNQPHNNTPDQLNNQQDDNDNNNNQQDDDDDNNNQQDTKIFDSELDQSEADEAEDDDQESVEQEEEAAIEPEPELTATGRPKRNIKPPDRLGEWTLFGTTTDVSLEEYDRTDALILARCMAHFANIASNPKHKHHNFIQTHSLKKGLKKFGTKGKDAAFGELKQLHDRIVFWPRKAEDLTQEELSKAMDSLIFLVEKRDGRIKARTCANGSIQRDYISKEESASPTVSTEAVLLTAVVDAHEGRDVMTTDIPNAFVQTPAEIKDGEERIIMKIQGPMVDMLCEIDPELYGPYVVYEKGTKTLYVEVLKAIYGMMQASLWFYKKFRTDIEQQGFKINPYDPCVANKIVNGKQHTVTFHVDDLKSSHVDSKVNDKFHEWLEKVYGDPKIGKVKSTRGKRHDYLAMVLDFSTPGVLKVDMVDCVTGVVDDFPFPLKEQKHPWTEKPFSPGNSPELDTEKKETFHTFVAKCLFVCKRARQDINPAIAYLTTRVRGPNQEDWKKLIKMLGFLKRTKKDVLHLSANSTTVLMWSVDASFAVHEDMKSHTGAVMTMGRGAIQSVSTKQKINACSSTESELVGIDDIIPKAVWTKLFMEEQGHGIKKNVVYRDNTSAMKLELNGKASSSKRTRHFNIKYFYVTDLIARGELTTEYCSTDLMTADYNTKPLLGEKFARFRAEIMGWG